MEEKYDPMECKGRLDCIFVQNAPPYSSPSGSSVDSRGKYKDVEGCIHKVSEVKVPSSGSRYFDFKVQERDESRRVVCFVADNWHEVKEKENSKSAVRLTSLSPQKRKYEPDTTEYRFNNYSKVMATKNLSLPWNDISGT